MKRKNNNNQERKHRIAFASNSIVILSMFIVIAIVLGLSAKISFADPEGASVTYIGNSTNAVSSIGNRSDPGGYIITMNLSSDQQNSRWKAYIGNVSGSLRLDDSTSQTIYEWAFATITGEVFATRASTITWADVACATETNLTTEDTDLYMTAGALDTVNNTYDSQAHNPVTVAGVPIGGSSCRSLAPFVSDTAQTQDVTADFQALLLHDRVNLIYTTILEANQVGYDDGLYDFQFIVADNATSQNTQYFFWVELG